MTIEEKRNKLQEYCRTFPSCSANGVCKLRKSSCMCGYGKSFISKNAHGEYDMSDKDVETAYSEVFQEPVKTPAKVSAKMKFMVGSRVRVARKPEIIHGEPGWVEAMDEEIGKVMTISRVFPGCASYEVDENIWTWHEDWLIDASDLSAFAVGDQVVANKAADKLYSITRQGWRGTVTKLLSASLDVRSKMDMGTFHVNPSCFDLVAKKTEATEKPESKMPEQKIVITHDGKTTTAVLYCGDKKVRDASAKCHEDDTFDFMTGASLALERLAHPPKSWQPNDFVRVIKDGVCHGFPIGSIVRLVRKEKRISDTWVAEGYSTTHGGMISQYLIPENEFEAIEK